MSATFLNTTTLTSAANATQLTLTVASNANHVVGEYIIVGAEGMQVQSKIGTTVINVQRGMLGTRARAHRALTTIVGSSISAFGPTIYDPFSGEQRVTLATAPAKADMPSYMLPLGSQRRDGLGNVFMLCDFTSPVFTGSPCQINSDYTANVIGAVGRGAFGIAAERGTSDQWGYVQIYGRCMVLLLGAAAGVSPSDDANGPTTLSTSAQTKFWLPTTGVSTGDVAAIRWTSGTVSTTSGIYIEGMTVATDASPSNDSSTVSVITGGVSHTGSQVSVFLNYPRIVHMNYGE